MSRFLPPSLARPPIAVHDRLIALAVGLAALALYGATLVPGVFDGDYGEFQYMPRLLGLPHPTGYPLYLLLGWLWSWLPLGSLAQRLNGMSALWGAVTVALLFVAGRQQRFSRVAALGGAVGMALAPFFWRYAALAAVYTLHTALLAGALALWLHWSARLRQGLPAQRALLGAALLSGLALTNHPTAAFLVPAALLFVAAHWLPRAGAARLPSGRSGVAAALAFALPGLLYAYVPLRLWQLGPGEQVGGLEASFAQGRIAPFLQWGMSSVLHYITGRSLLPSYEVRWPLLLSDLPPLLVDQVGVGLAAAGVVGLLLWLRRAWRGALLLAALFVPAALYAVSYAADFAARGEIAHLEGHILPALLAFCLWAMQGLDALQRLLGRLLHRPALAALLVAGVVAGTLWQAHRGQPLPTEGDRVQSAAITRYWSEVLAYPLEPGAALTGHWGDLTAFWYFQQGEGQRRDLWALFPPEEGKVATWLRESERPLYLAGPLLSWGGEWAQGYRLIPWGILVRIAAPQSEPTLPAMAPVGVRLAEQLTVEGYRVEALGPGRLQLWLLSRTLAPTPRDLALSVRLHGPDGALLLQQDGRLASLWYPEGTLPPATPILSVADVTLPTTLPPGSVARLVIYDPASGEPLRDMSGQDVVTLGPLGP